MAKHEHRGTCQACGRVQAVTARGTIAKHGYSVALGFFNGVCVGAREQPLEVSKVAAETKYIPAFAEQAAALEAKTLADVALVTLEAWDHQQHRYTVRMTRDAAEYAAARHPDNSHYAQPAIAAREWLSARQAVLASWMGDARRLRSHIGFLQGMIASRYGQPLRPAEHAPECQRESRWFNNGVAARDYMRSMIAAGWRCSRRTSRKHGGYSVTATRAKG